MRSERQKEHAVAKTDYCCTIEIRVRYAEVDRMGVAHHSRYWAWFEMGRTELLRNAGLRYGDLEDRGVYLAIAKCSARYIHPARYDDMLTLTTCRSRTGRASIEHAYQLNRKSDGVLLTTAETTLACIDKEGRVIPLPDEIREL